MPQFNERSPQARTDHPPGFSGSLGLQRGLLPGLVGGGVAGLGETLAAGARRLLRGELAFVPEHFWWSAPLLNGVLVAGLTILAVAIWPTARAQHLDRVRLALPLTLVIWVALRIAVPGLHVAGAWILALGLGVRVAGWLTSPRFPLEMALRVALPLVLLAGPLVSYQLFRLPPLAQPPDGGPQPVTAERPNILLIILDTVRAMELSLYGAESPTTPVLERLGRQGVVFEQASSTAPWTLPSHASLFTGRWAHEMPAGLLTPLDRRDATLAEVLTRHGYTAAGFTANVEYASAGTGLARGFHHYEDYQWSLSGLLAQTRVSRALLGPLRRVLPGGEDTPGRIGAYDINARFLRWLDREPRGRFFAFVNFYDAHAPYYPPEPYWGEFVGAEPRRPLNNSDHLASQPEAVALQRRAYQGAIRHVDAAIGQLLDALEARGILNQSLVIITSDHGEEFAEHGLLGHTNSLYYPSVHVPLLLLYPDHVPVGCRVETPVSIRQIPATIMDLLGAPGSFPGGSLRDAWSGGGGAAPPVLTHTQRAINQPAHYPASRGPLFGAQRGGIRLLVESDPPAAAAFDLVADPGERVDQSSNTALRAEILRLLDALEDAGTPGVEIATLRRTMGEAPPGRPEEQGVPLMAGDPPACPRP